MQVVGIWTFESTNRRNHHIFRQGRRCTSEWGRNNHVKESLRKKCLDSWRPITDRIVEARFFSCFIKTTVIQVYAPTNEADDEVKDYFYEQLQKIVDEMPSHDMLLVIGDWNAKVGEQQLGEEGIVGTFGMTGERSDNVLCLSVH